MKKFLFKRLGIILTIAAISVPTAAEALDVGGAARWLGETIRDYRPGDMGRMATQMGNDMRQQREQRRQRRIPGEPVTTGFSTRVRVTDYQPAITASAKKRRRSSGNTALISYNPQSQRVRQGNGQRRQFRQANRRRVYRRF